MILQDFYDGRSFDAYEFFGVHIEDGKTVFRTYAPNAKSIAVIGEFNGWQKEYMTQTGRSGVFTFASDKAKKGDMYKYAVEYPDGNIVDHCDPYGFGMQLRPDSATYITDISGYSWHDDEWMRKRTRNFGSPLSIYEVHLGSWHTNPENENGWYRYNEIADRLIAYVKENGFTHIEFMPLAEHPSDDSWGYQNTGFYSPTARYGTARELMELVDRCHMNGIGVIMDFVPVHFAIDGYGLNHFDGTELYEFPVNDTSVSEWGTLNFNHSRREVACFLQSCANYWLKEYHFDGIRMDAISRAIYWQGDIRRGVNDRALEFIRNMNEGLHRLHPTAMLIAEDSTAFPKVTAPVEYDGLGFDYKWDLGWMNDTLEYFKIPPQYRPDHYYKLIFSMDYFFSENFILPFSHDEVVHGKATITKKMWGDYEYKFPQARALYMYMFAHPGKKLNFMGNELGQFREWDEKREQDWDMLKYPLHDSFHRYFRDLNMIYQKYPQLHEEEMSDLSFRWLESMAPDKSVYVFELGTGKKTVIAAFNFSDNDYSSYTFNTRGLPEVTEIINSEYDYYSGTVSPGTENPDIKYHFYDEYSEISVHLPPFSGKLLLAERTDKKPSELNDQVKK